MKQQLERLPIKPFQISSDLFDDPDLEKMAKITPETTANRKSAILENRAL